MPPANAALIYEEVGTRDLRCALLCAWVRDHGGEHTVGHPPGTARHRSGLRSRIAEKTGGADPADRRYAVDARHLGGLAGDLCRASQQRHELVSDPRGQLDDVWA